MPVFISFITLSLTIYLDFLAVGVVILISIAIAAGVVFLLVLIGILWTLFARRDNRKVEYAMFDDDVSSEHQRPSSLLEHINAATRGAILGGASPFAHPSDHDADRHIDNEKEDEMYGAAGAAGLSSSDPFAAEHDGDNFRRAETPSDAIAMGGMAAEESGRPAHARYSFDGGGEGELPLDEGMSLEILDDRDPK